MSKEEAIKEIEEYIADADKAISEDPEYIRGWKSALLVALEILTKLEEPDVMNQRVIHNCFEKKDTPILDAMVNYERSRDGKNLYFEGGRLKSCE